MDEFFRDAAAAGFGAALAAALFSMRGDSDLFVAGAVFVSVAAVAYVARPRETSSKEASAGRFSIVVALLAWMGWLIGGCFEFVPLPGHRVACFLSSWASTHAVFLGSELHERADARSYAASGVVVALAIAASASRSTYLLSGGELAAHTACYFAYFVAITWARIKTGRPVAARQAVCASLWTLATPVRPYAMWWIPVCASAVLSARSRAEAETPPPAIDSRVSTERTKRAFVASARAEPIALRLPIHKPRRDAAPSSPRNRDPLPDVEAPVAATSVPPVAFVEVAFPEDE